MRATARQFLCGLGNQQQQLFARQGINSAPAILADDEFRPAFSLPHDEQASGLGNRRAIRPGRRIVRERIRRGYRGEASQGAETSPHPPALRRRRSIHADSLAHIAEPNQ